MSMRSSSTDTGNCATAQRRHLQPMLNTTGFFCFTWLKTKSHTPTMTLVVLNAHLITFFPWYINRFKIQTGTARKRATDFAVADGCVHEVKWDKEA